MAELCSCAVFSCAGMGHPLLNFVSLFSFSFLYSLPLSLPSMSFFPSSLCLCISVTKCLRYQSKKTKTFTFPHSSSVFDPCQVAHHGGDTNREKASSLPHGILKVQKAEKPGPRSLFQRDIPVSSEDFQTGLTS